MKILFVLVSFLALATPREETRLAFKRGGHLNILAAEWQVIDGSKIGEGVEFLLIHKTLADLKARVLAGKSQTGVPTLKKSCQGARDTFHATHRPYCQRSTPSSLVLEFVHVLRTQNGYVYVPYTVHFDGTALQLSTWKPTIESFAQLLASRP